MTKDELLRILLEDDNIELSISADNDNMAKKYLSQHPYQIWQNKNGRWFSYLPPEEGEKRRQISSKTKEELEKKIVNYWNGIEDNPTVYQVFKDWLRVKLELDEVKPATVSRYQRDFKSYCEPIKNKKIRDVTEMDIDLLMRTAVSKHHLKTKRYSNIRTLIYGIFDTARKKGYVSFRIKEVVADITISKKAFDSTPKPNHEQIFFPEEEKKFTDYIIENPSLQNLGLLLLFKTGLRMGELVALKPTDIDGNKIHVSRTETRYTKDDGTVVTEVQDCTKTDAGTRTVLVTNDSIWILKKLRALNLFGEWLFVTDKGNRVTANTLRQRWYRICDKSGVPRKSPHKARKTYGTKLYDANVPESLICSQMGHTTIACLKQYYYFDMNSENDKMNLLNMVQNL